jgi:hypothetical protein
MTNILRRAERPVEVAGLARASGRRLAARRIGLADAGGPLEPAELAPRLGLSEPEARLIGGEGALTEDDLLPLAAALARLQPGGPRLRQRLRPGGPEGPG